MAVLVLANAVYRVLVVMSDAEVRPSCASLHLLPIITTFNE